MSSSSGISYISRVITARGGISNMFINFTETDEGSIYKFTIVGPGGGSASIKESRRFIGTYGAGAGETRTVTFTLLANEFRVTEYEFIGVRVYLKVGGKGGKLRIFNPGDGKDGKVVNVKLFYKYKGKSKDISVVNVAGGYGSKHIFNRDDGKYILRPGESSEVLEQDIPELPGISITTDYSSGEGGSTSTITDILSRTGENLYTGGMGGESIFNLGLHRFGFGANGSGGFMEFEKLIMHGHDGHDSGFRYTIESSLSNPILS